MEKFEPREWQNSLITTISKNLEEKNTMAIEAPTGSGKTSFILYLSFLTNKKIIYLTRTHNEFSRIYEDNYKYFNLPIIYLYGKSSLCPLKERWYDTDEESQKNVCKGCILKDKISIINLNSAESPEDFIEYLVDDSTEKIRKDIENKNVERDSKGNLMVMKNDKIISYCPYYSIRSTMKNARIIVMTYNYLLNPAIRYSIFYGDEESINLNDYYVVFDEAHNLDSVLENFGRSISQKYVDGAIKQLVDNFPLDKYRCHERIEANLILEKLMDNFNSEKADYSLKLFKFNNDIKSRLNDIGPLRKFLEEYEKINEEKSFRERKRNYLESVYNFLDEYNHLENGDIYLTVEGKRENIKLKIMYYNTSEYLSFLKDKAVIFMSGTMPSAEHVSKVWNFDSVLYLKVNELFFNTGGVKKYDIIRGFTTVGKYRENLGNWSSMLKHYMEFSLETYNKSEKSVLVAVPSYKILFGDSEKQIPGIASFLPSDMRKNAVFETKKISFSSIAKRAYREKLIIFSVHGGKLLEGIQIIKDRKSLISDVIIAGLPLIPMDDYRKNKIKYLTKTLEGNNMYNILYYEYALIKVKQAAGRSTRSPEDSANIYLCDDRFDSSYWRENLLT